jgi:hypothetical protein
MLPLIAPVVFIAAFQGTRSWGDLYMLVGFGVLGWVMKRLNWPRPPMVLGLVVGKIFERYLFISMQIYGDAWLLRPVVMVVGLLIVWALYAPMKQTVVRLYREVRGLHWDHLRFGLNAAFSTFIIAVIGGALMTSADWPAIERIVPRAACWSALVAAGLNLLTEVFGADQATADAHDAAPALELALPGGVVLQRAAVYFGWLAGLLVLIALVGFVPAIGIFILIYMRLGFGESWRNAAICASVTTLLCWGVFDRGLSVPWPQAALGDAVPWLRESTDLM